ncbi:hypothetical protein DPSP01_013384 [Paraphaeosphaeria sporulosa]
MEHLTRLRKRLRDCIQGGYIPGGLKEAIEQEPAFRMSLSMEPIDEGAFDYEDKRTLAHPTLVYMLQEVKDIYQSGELCTRFRRDQGAWPFTVFRPLIELVIKLHGKSKWRLENVQSQNIAPQYLPCLAGRPVVRKTDFSFSYSCLDPSLSTLYKRLEEVNAMPVSHTTDNFTSRVLLYSGFEIKPENGDQKEAELQMGIWMAANLRKKTELAKKAALQSKFSQREHAPAIPVDQDPSESQDHENDDDDRSIHALVEPGHTMIGHEHKIYYAYPTSANGGTTVLGPDEKLLNLSTRSPEGIFKLIVIFSNILDYGYGTEPGEGLWNGYLRKVIEGLCRNT